MRLKTWASGAAQFAAVTAGCAILVGLAGAQAVEEITVEAERVIDAGQTPHGMPIREVTIRSKVSYSDLDLATDAGAGALEDRVEQAAKSACKEMNVKFPAAGSGEEVCVKEAVSGAMVEARKVIDAARATAAK
jgi:UrcA family protein